MREKKPDEWICMECAWFNSKEDLKCRNRTCSNTKEKQETTHKREVK